jgi:hypothetical protein
MALRRQPDSQETLKDLQEIAPMTKTVTCLFDSEQHATAAARELEGVGIAPGDCEIWSTPHNLDSVLEDGGVAYATAHAYVDGVIRGGTVLIVTCDDGKVATVVDILDREDIPVTGATERPEEPASPAGAEVEAARAAEPETVGQGRVRVHVRKEPRSPE